MNNSARIQKSVPEELHPIRRDYYQQRAKKRLIVAFCLSVCIALLAFYWNARMGHIDPAMFIHVGKVKPKNIIPQPDTAIVTSETATETSQANSSDQVAQDPVDSTAAAVPKEKDNILLDAKKNEVKPAREDNASTVTYRDRFQSCRYSFQVKYQRNGGVDIFVLDSYTGHMRARFGYISNEPFTLFTRDTHTAKRRFFEVRAEYQVGNNEVFISDSFTGDIQCKSNPEHSQSIVFFEKCRPGDLTRFSAQVIFNSGKLDFVISDDCTSETRVTRGLDSQDRAISLFTEMPAKPNERPHYFSWAEFNNIDIDLFTLDTIDSTLRVRRKIGNEKNVRLFTASRPDDPPRFWGWINFNQGHAEFWSTDEFAGIIRKDNDISDKNEVRLFNTPQDSAAWQRFDIRMRWNTDHWEVFVFDLVTAELSFLTITNAAKEWHLQDAKANQAPENNRYRIAYMPQLLGGTGYYVLDTYTSEIRCGQEIKVNSKINLFK